MTSRRRIDRRLPRLCRVATDLTKSGDVLEPRSVGGARLDRELPRDSGVRLVSISVDPEHDTPQVLQRYAAWFDGLQVATDEDWVRIDGVRR